MPFYKYLSPPPISQDAWHRMETSTGILELLFKEQTWLNVALVLSSSDSLTENAQKKLLVDEIQRCKSILTKNFFPTIQTRLDFFKVLKNECKTIGNGLQAVEEASLDQRQHQLFIAGNYLFLEFSFNSLDQISKVKFEFPEADGQTAVEKSGVEYFLFQMVKEQKAREILDAIHYLAHIDRLSTNYQNVFWNLQCLANDLKKLSITKNLTPLESIGLPSINQQRLGISLIFYVMPEKQLSNSVSVYDTGVFSIFITIDGLSHACRNLTKSQTSFLTETCDFADLKTLPGTEIAPFGFVCHLQSPMPVTQITLGRLDNCCNCDVICDNLTTYENLVNVDCAVPNATSSAYLLTSFSIHEPSVLLEVIPILRRQAIYNELVRNYRNTPIVCDFPSLDIALPGTPGWQGRIHLTEDLNWQVKKSGLNSIPSTASNFKSVQNLETALKHCGKLEVWVQWLLQFRINKE
ncbi:hypothetical protein HMI54_014646 [Coelomomyces lativittatus]|nr:hypothetical protein HMI56_003764 [Coelomomyces lativittatus]KAJ1518583.1 hypothetical protein HMI54_014646 [Coelomomyces lativittatus]